MKINKELVEQFRQGEHEAWERIWKILWESRRTRIQGLLYRLLDRYRVKAPPAYRDFDVYTTAEDLAQTTWMNAYRCPPKHENFDAWLNTIARNQYRDWKDKHERSVRTLEGEAEVRNQRKEAEEERIIACAKLSEELKRIQGDFTAITNLLEQALVESTRKETRRKRGKVKLTVLFLYLECRSVEQILSDPDAKQRTIQSRGERKPLKGSDLTNWLDREPSWVWGNLAEYLVKAPDRRRIIFEPPLPNSPTPGLFVEELESPRQTWQNEADLRRVAFMLNLSEEQARESLEQLEAELTEVLSKLTKPRDFLGNSRFCAGKSWSWRQNSQLTSDD